MHRAELFTKIDGTTLRCLACSHYCTIKDGDTGVCGVRFNQSGHLFLSVYGRPAAVNIDPIEKKLFYHFLPNTKTFSLGTWGCNFECDFCKNFYIAQYPEKNRPVTNETEIESLLKNCQTWPPQKIIEHCLEMSIPSIAYNYNEPAVFIEYAFDIARLAYQRNFKNILVSNGYQSRESIKYIEPYLDAINIYFKSINPDFYKKVCKADVSPVLNSIKYYAVSDVWLELTTVLVPNLNDSEQEINQMAEFIAKTDPEIPWHITAFHPAYKMHATPATKPESLEEAYNIARSHGIKYVYTGNTDNGHKDTYCPSCGELLIKRTFLNIESMVIDNKCPACHTYIAGVWN